MNKIVIGGLVMAMLSTGAFAQTAAMNPVAFKSVDKMDSDAFASNLVGLDVYNNANEDVGEIKDFVMSADNRVAGVVLSVGGFLGLGAKYIVVDPKSLAIAHDDSKKAWTAKIDATKDQLTSAKEFKYEGKFSD